MLMADASAAPSGPRTQPLREALREAPTEAPLLALGQTVFWDEPMKATVALAARELELERPFVAGVHDTDYFAKLPAKSREPGRFRVLAHNDTTTRGLWSAAAEFSALFGSETVVEKSTLLNAGLRLHAVEEADPRALDEATEAWGWRGVVSLDENPPIAAEVPMERLFPALRDALDWALAQSLDLVEEDRSRAVAQRVHEILCEDPAARRGTLGELYERALPSLYALAAGEPVPLSVTRTTELLRFEPETATRPRFEILDLFVNPETRPLARAAYDEAVRGGSGQYELARFGTGAVPFDVVIPGRGRGTLRLGTKGAVIMTPKPAFLTFREEPRGVEDLARALRDKFGPGVVIVGKAVALIGMLAREFSFVFHEGASGYVRHSVRFHQALAQRIRPMAFHPILRVRYRTWDALEAVSADLRLPEPFRRPFRTEGLSAREFAARWREVVQDGEWTLSRLGELHQPSALMDALAQAQCPDWKGRRAEYTELRQGLEGFVADLREIRDERRRLYAREAAAVQARQIAEQNLGAHWRANLFDREPTAEATAERDRLQAQLREALAERERIRNEVRALRRRQAARVADPEVRRTQERLRTLELEAERERMRLVREAVVTARGLPKAALRPSAWWIPLVSPGGEWFREVSRTVQAWWEPLV